MASTLLCAFQAPRPRMCGDGGSVGLDFGRACQGEARHSKRSVGNLQAVMEKGTVVHSLMSWNGPQFTDARLHFIDPAVRRGPGMTGRNGTRNQASQQAVPSPTLSPVHSYKEKDSGVQQESWHRKLTEKNES